MKDHDEFKKLVEELRASEVDMSLLRTLVGHLKKGKKYSVLVLLRPARRFEQTLARAVARANRECNIHCWKRLGESLPVDLKSGKKGGAR